jgi:prepilin-type N-terminal cleavage/methylation domain-containing protein
MLSRLRREAHEDQRGFTLIELMVVITLTTLIGGMVLSAVIQTFQTQRRHVAQLEVMNDAKLTLERVGRELRAADPLQVGEASRAEVQISRGGTPQVFSFQLEPSAGGTQRLRLCNSALGTCGAATGRIVLDGIVPTAGYRLFRYYDAAGTEITAASLTSDELERVVRVRLHLRAGLPGGTAVTDFVDDLALRNAEG